MPFFTIFTIFVYNVCKLWTFSKERLYKNYFSSNLKLLPNSGSCEAGFPQKNKMSRPPKIIKLIKSVKPTRMWIDGKSFHIAEHDEKDLFNNKAHNYIEEYKSHYNINFHNDLYHTRFQLPGIYYEKLHTFPHFTIKELEEYTNANINIPQTNEESIVVSSKDIENVINARNQLHSVFSIIREGQNVLQFISIPTINEDLRAKFKCFKKEVLQIEKVDGMHESIFQKPERLHLTVGVFSLFNDIERSEAIKVLNECKDNVIDPIVSKSGPLRITVSGLECMNNNYKKVNVLYANAKICTENEEDILQSMLNSISKHFYEKGFIRQYKKNVKIHVTLMNTKYRKSNRKRKWTNKRQPFDASIIMEKYKDFHFGECDLKEIHLSWMGQTDDNGFYKPLSIITI